MPTPRFALPAAVLLSTALAALGPLPARAGTLIWSDNLDSYPSGACTGPWTCGSGGGINGTISLSPPNSIQGGGGGFGGHNTRALGSTVQTGYAEFDAYLVDPNGCGNCGWVTTYIAPFETSGGNSFATLRFGNVGSPPSGSVGIDFTDCADVGVAFFNVTAAVWHHFSMAMSCTGSSGDFVSLSVDGTPISVSASTVNASDGQQMDMAGQTIGGSPPFEFAVDNIQIFSGSPASAAAGDESGGITQ